MAALFRRLKSRMTRGFVLAFHDIEPDRLAQLVESIQPAEAVSLTELVDRSKRGKSTSGLFAITVDDGVGETVRNLSRLFCARGWPATFYICTGYVDSPQGMCFQWWRKIMPLLPAETIELAGVRVDLTRRGAIETMAKRMEVMWHTRRPEEYFPLTLELADIVVRERGVTMDSIQPPKAITWSEIEQLSRNEILSFESHGVTHTAVSALTDEELAFEMQHSRELVSAHTGRTCRHFAYPFGSVHSIGTRAAGVAKLFYESASTMTLGSVDSANPWLLPRVPLYPENSSLHANLKLLLTCSRLSAHFISDAKRQPAEAKWPRLQGETRPARVPAPTGERPREIGRHA